MEAKKATLGPNKKKKEKKSLMFFFAVNVMARL